MNLTERQSDILRKVVERYIATYEPVGSAEIARMMRAEVSPATIRAEMKELEDAGWLLQPHTSAGRIPTDKGYRFFVNHLRESQRELERVQRELLQKELILRQAHRQLAEVAQALSEFTHSMSLLSSSSGFLVQGHKHLVSQPEFTDIASEMMEVLDDPANFMKPIAEQLDQNEVAAFIGDEWSGNNLSLVAGRFGRHGIVGVIGPKRMDYKKVIPAVEVIIEVLND